MSGNSAFTALGITAVAILAVMSCSKERLIDGRKADGNSISFGVSAIPVEENAGRQQPAEDSPLTVVGEDGKDTLYLHPDIKTNLSAIKGRQAETKGVPINSKNFGSNYSDFGVMAYLSGSDGIYMDNDRIGNNSGTVWSSSEGDRFWPEDGTPLDFYAYAPYTYRNQAVFSGNQAIARDDDGNIKFSYSVPVSGDGHDAEIQPDIMFAYTPDFSRSDAGNEINGTVPLRFQHALSGIRFVVKDVNKCTIRKIALKNLYKAGSCTYTIDKTGGGGAFAWTLEGELTDFSQIFDVTVENNTGTSTQPVSSDETTFMMIPQDISGAKIEIVLEIDGTEYLLEGPLYNPAHKSAAGDEDLSTWDAGKIYTYEISTDSVNWVYVFEITAEDNGTVQDGTPLITLSLGNIEGNYYVTSYRYRRTDPSITENIGWTAEWNSGTETDEMDNTSESVSYEEAVTAFTGSGSGGTESARDKGTVGVTKNTMKTNYPGDEILMSSEPKGSPDNPYDLSTHDESGNTIARTTANCYVVNAPGTYKLPLVYGNAIKNGAVNYSSWNSDFKDYVGNQISGPYISGTPHDCVLVWSDGFFMFKDIHLDTKSADGPYLVFSIDRDFLQQANGVVAVRDNQGRIMWSWHIWVTERNIYTENIHNLYDYKDGSSRIYRMMQCNLGWVDGKIVYYNGKDLEFDFYQSGSGKTGKLKVRQTGYEFNYKDVGSTYYQWGRKDPLVALRNWENVGYADYRLHETGEDSYGYRYVEGRVSIGTAIQNPNVFYPRRSGDGYGDWLDSNPVATLWDTSGGTGMDKTTSTKTIYDPSPRGFKVPVARAFAVLVNGNTGDGSNADNIGTFNGKSQGEVPNNPLNNQYIGYSQPGMKGDQIPMTATGQRSDRQGLLERYEKDGAKADLGGLWAMYGVYYWSCIDSGTSAYTLVIRKDYPRGIEVYSFGFNGTKTMARPVRPIIDE